jgi:hypothetical protein
VGHGPVSRPCAVQLLSALPRPCGLSDPRTSSMSMIALRRTNGARSCRQRPRSGQLASSLSTGVERVNRVQKGVWPITTYRAAPRALMPQMRPALCRSCCGAAGAWSRVTVLKSLSSRRAHAWRQILLKRRVSRLEAILRVKVLLHWSPHRHCARAARSVALHR